MIISRILLAHIIGITTAVILVVLYSKKRFNQLRHRDAMDIEMWKEKVAELENASQELKNFHNGMFPGNVLGEAEEESQNDKTRDE